VRIDHSHQKAMTDRGFTLIELLLASLLLLMVSASVAMLAVPMRHAFERSTATADVSAGSRALLERLSADLREAGTGAAVSPGLLRFAAVAPTIVPLASLTDLSVAVPARAVRIVRLEPLGAQGVLRSAVAPGAAWLQLETSNRCANSGGACGFEVNQIAMLFDESRAVQVRVTAVTSGGGIRLAAGLPASFEPGAVLARAAITTYGARPDADGSQRLVRAGTAGVEQPILQNVVDFQVSLSATPSGVPEGDLAPLTTAQLTDGPWRLDVNGVTVFDADLLRGAQADVTLRVEAASMAMRGPAGRFFRRPGSSRTAAQWVPDLELRFSIALRNVWP